MYKYATRYAVFLLVISLLVQPMMTVNADSVVDYTITYEDGADDYIVGAYHFEELSSALAVCSDDGADDVLTIQLGSGAMNALPIFETGTWLLDKNALISATYTGWIDIRRYSDEPEEHAGYGVNIPNMVSVTFDNVEITDDIQEGQEFNYNWDFYAIKVSAGGNLHLKGGDIVLNGQRVSAIRNDAGTVSITDGANITMMTNSSYAIKNVGGNVTVNNENGILLTFEDNSVTCINTQSGEFSVVAGTIRAIKDSSSAFNNETNSVITISGGIIETINEAGRTIVNYESTLNITGGIVRSTNSDTYTIYMNDDAIMNMSGGTISCSNEEENMYAIRVVEGTLDITGGIIESGTNHIRLQDTDEDDESWMKLGATTIYSSANAEIFIKGAEVDGKYTLKSDNYGDALLVPADYEDEMTFQWASDAERTALISNVLNPTLSSLITGDNEGVTHVYLALADVTAPSLTEGDVARTSDTAGTVKFTSDEAGSYYYAIVADGAEVPPVIDTSGVGTACTTAETTITNPTGLTAGARDIYIKVKDAAGNVSDALMIAIEAYVALDVTAPSLTEGDVARTSDTAGTVKFTSDEAGSYYYAVVADGAEVPPVIDTSGVGTACTTAETTITNPTGLTAGAKDIYIKVKDAAGNVSDALKIDISVYAPSDDNSNGGSSSGGTSSQVNQELVVVIVNGKAENAGTETTTIEEGMSVVTVEVNNKVIENKIEEAIKNNPTGTNNLIQVPVADMKSDIVKVELTGDIIKKLEENAFDLSIKRDDVEYLIPAEEFTISNVAKDLGVAEGSLKDIKIEVKITKLDEAVVAKYNEVAKANGAELVFPPVEFEIIAKTTKTDGTKADVEISKFSNYVERIMEIPAGVDISKITTGIVFNPDGTYSHVPTEVFQKDGKWYARLNSLTNSNYSVVWNPVTVKSVENHWSKDAVNDMASRLVIFNAETFDPNKAITRADFAEYIVRALGLYREGSKHENKFKDVSATGDRTLAILIANEYGIVTGYPDGAFRPDQQITREEAMAMYQRAMKVTKLVGIDYNRYQNYTDHGQVGSWATDYVKAVLSAHVFNGTTATTISPKANLTYSEAAQAIKNLLVESKLINK